MNIQKATVEDIPAIIELLKKRIQWMDEMNLYQWNKTDYLGVYPYEYFVKRVEQDVMFVAVENSAVIAVMALLPEDPRWPIPAAALYVHHLATDPARKGIGIAMLEFAEQYTLSIGKTVLRLDCQKVNPVLNRYYEALGYVHKGECIDGAYVGNLMEKVLQERE